MKTRLTIIFSLLFFLGCSPARKTRINEFPIEQEKFLIITADDFGASRNINEGIELAVEKKAITSISVLSNFSESISELRAISENHPEIGIGVHLNITTGKPVLGAESVPSLVNSDGDFFPIEAIIPRIKSISLDELRMELRAQVLALVKNDIRIDHLSDQCGLLSFYSPFFNIVLELAKEFNICVRTPEIASVKYPRLFPNSKMHARGIQIALRSALGDPFKVMSLVQYSGKDEMERKVQRMNDQGIMHPDLLIECFWGDPTISNYLYILEHIPAGTSEILVHLGTSTRQDSYPSGLDLAYFKNRELELNAVTSEYLEEYYCRLNIKPISYSGMQRVKRLN
jgi:predicted glycoside hydrolase/deacetylase ChbG (UPF0249 family)